MKRKRIILIASCAALLFSCTSGASLQSDVALNHSLVEEILGELNYVRTNPAQYASRVLQPMVSRFNGNTYSAPGKVSLITHEGVGAVNECINALKNTQPLGSLSLETGLCRSAKWLADDQASTGHIGHTGSDDSNMQSRMNRFGRCSGTCGENCAYGSRGAREIVAQLLIDDGVPGRGHRKNILNGSFKKVGIGFNSTGRAPYGAVTVMDFAASYTSN